VEEEESCGLRFDNRVTCSRSVSRYLELRMPSYRVEQSRCGLIILTCKIAVRRKFCQEETTKKGVFIVDATSFVPACDPDALFRGLWGASAF